MQEALNYTIDERDPDVGGVIRSLARIENLRMATTAYHQAIATRPNAHIVLRQKARVIREKPVSKSYWSSVV